MLTQSDLGKLDRLVAKRVRQEIRLETKSVKADISSIKKDAGTLKSDVKILKLESKANRRDIKIIKRNLNSTISQFDREYGQLKDRVEKVEINLGIN